MGIRKKSKAIKFLEKISGGPLTFARIIRANRLGEGYSQTEMAKILKISKAQLCDLEKGRRGISPEKAAEFARALGKSEKFWVKIALQEQLDKAGLKMTVQIEAA